MTTQTNTKCLCDTCSDDYVWSIKWQCSVCTVNNKLPTSLCEMCGAKNPKSYTLNVVEMANSLITGYLKSVGLQNSINEINCLIRTYYKSHVSFRYCRSNSEMLCFSLQSQTRNSINCPPQYEWTFRNDNLIYGKISFDNYYSVMNNISSNAIFYPIHQYLDTGDTVEGRTNIGYCVSTKRGIFAIGGYDQDCADSTNGVQNIQWNGGVTKLACYWHGTWSSTPLFIDNDNKVINIGGGEGLFGHCSQIVGLYDFTTDQWKKLADIPYPSQDSGAYYNQSDETVYVTGGYCWRTKACVRYSAHSNQWQEIGETNWSYDTYESPCVSVIDNSLVLVTSEDDNGLRMEYLDVRTPDTKFTVMSSMDDLITYDDY